ncbi:transcription elongation factor A protein 2-like [Denticeps clupeoides]|uniref:transcription elongation factor A protein 2-like n=1 Tax=Denticeps clupeoides TaxID=299321 RepID=UPI0010A2ABA3|nr:transcription elongation factor A protein 2-like [Denticeps clupeoides]
MEQEVKRMAKKLDAMVKKKSTEGALDVLRELKNMKMSLETLQSSRIGMTVNAVRKQSSDEEVQSLAKSLIKTWKKLLDDSKEDEKKDGSPLILPSSSKKPCEPKTPNSPKAHKSTPKITTFPPVPVTSDSVRTKCKELLESALQTGDDYKTIGADCACLAAEIEHFIFHEFKSADLKYKTRLRSRISNLKDQKNPELRRGVLSGAITPERIAKMSAEEMASDELKGIRQALTKESIREHQLSKVGGTETDMFVCGKCKGKNCTYNQVQTRSADEPMTTFVVCNGCGNRWKFC